MFSSDNRREGDLSRIVARLLNGDDYLDEDQYISGIPALLLTYGAQPELLPWERVRSAYARFEKVCPVEKRLAVFQTLAAFSGQMRGLSLHVWEPVFRNESNEGLRYAASHAAMILSSAGEDDPFAGVRAMLSWLERDGEADLLNGLFLTCDMRLLPLAAQCWEALAPERRIWKKAPVMSYPAVEFFVQRIISAEDEEEKRSLLNGLVQMPHAALTRPPVCFYHPFPPPHPDYNAPQVIDAVTPIPAWKYPDTEPQVLHTWTCPEYLARFLPRLEGKITEEARTALVKAWSSPTEAVSLV